MKTNHSLLTSAICVVSAFTIPFTMSPPKAVAQTVEQNTVCSNATLNGAYAFELTGFEGNKAPFTPLAVVRYTTLNGAGQWSGRGFRVLGSNVLENRVSGTYKVESNCTVRFNYSVFRLNGTKADEATLFGVIVDNGNKVRVVLTKDASVPGTYSGVFERVR